MPAAKYPRNARADPMSFGLYTRMRDDSNRFIKQCESGAKHTVEELAEQGAEYSRILAPLGEKTDPRTLHQHLKNSIFVKEATEGTAGAASGWYAEARHAKFVEEGNTRALIRADRAWFWRNVPPQHGGGSRWWVPAGKIWWKVNPSTGRVEGKKISTEQMIDHPADAAQPYLQPALVLIGNNVQGTLKKNYPQ